MDEVCKIVAELCMVLHPERINAVVSKIESLDTVGSFTQIKQFFGPNVDKSLLDHLEKSLCKTNKIQPYELAAVFRAASMTAGLFEKRNSIQMVWTGPSSGMVPIRHTEQVLCEVIESAQNKLFIVSFVAYQLPSIINSLQSAINRQVKVDILLETSTDHGGKVTSDSFKTMKVAVPSANFYVWKIDKEKIGTTDSNGAVHAKCAVSDEKVAFITSANLTTAAMERNMELGVLIKGGHLPSQLHKHLETLVTTEIIIPI